jgi:hypothetical protein
LARRTNDQGVEGRVKDWWIMPKNILFSLIGKETTPNYRAYCELMPDVLIHIYSDITKSASDILVSMIDDSKTEVILLEVNGENYYDTLSKLQEFDFGIIERDTVSINITGGTKMMALALTEYSESIKTAKLHFFYIDRSQNIHWYRENRIDVLHKKLALDEFIQLQGQKIKSKETFVDVVEKFKNSITQINSILSDFSKKKDWDSFLKYFVAVIRRLHMRPENKNKSIYNIYKNWYQVNEQLNLRITWDESLFEVYVDNKLLVKLEQTKAEIEWFIFNAGWFEIITAIKLSTKYDQDNLFMNVCFPLRIDAQLLKNEVDILINDGGKLIFIECKSGDVKSEDINSIKIRKDTYGGLIGENLLVTQYEIEKKIILEKCQELDIKTVVYSKL